MNNTSDKRHSLEQRIRAGVLAGTLTLTALGSGCATPEDFMLGAAAAGLGGLSPNITPQQALVLGVTRDVAGMGAGVAAQRESSERIAGAIQGQYVSGGPGTANESAGSMRAYQQFDSAAFGRVEIYMGRPPLGYQGEEISFSPQQLSLQTSFRKQDIAYVVCNTRVARIKNLSARLINEEGTIIDEKTISGWGGGGVVYVRELDFKPGRYAVIFQGHPAFASRNTSPYIGTIEFTVTE